MRGCDCPAGLPGTGLPRGRGRDVEWVRGSPLLWDSSDHGQNALRELRARASAPPGDLVEVRSTDAHPHRECGLTHPPSGTPRAQRHPEIGQCRRLRMLGHGAGCTPSQGRVLGAPLAGRAGDSDAIGWSRVDRIRSRSGTPLGAVLPQLVAFGFAPHRSDPCLPSPRSRLQFRGRTREWRFRKVRMSQKTSENTAQSCASDRGRKERTRAAICTCPLSDSGTRFLPATVMLRRRRHFRDQPGDYLLGIFPTTPWTNQSSESWAAWSSVPPAGTLTIPI